MPTLRFKILLLGEGLVGKTTFKNRFLLGKFTTGYTATLGADFASHTMFIEDKRVVMSIWDMAGQKSQANLRKPFYSGANGALILYDVTKTQTFSCLETDWFMPIEEVLKFKIPVLLVGNKIDLSTTRIVTYENGLNLLNKVKRLGWYAEYLETSALDGTNVNKAFTNLVWLMLDDYNQKHK